MKLSIIIPAYNEGKRIIPTLDSVGEYLKKQPFEAEVIVVANGCTDNTAEVSRSFTSKIKNLRVLDIVARGGKGWAIKKGMEKAVGDAAVFMDADNATQISEIENFWKYFEQSYDVVIGSRALPKSVITRKQPWYRQLIGRGGNLLIQALLIPGIKDTQCGFKAFSKRAYQSVFPRLTIYGWGFDLEVLAVARFQGFNVKEEAITWRDQGESRVQPLNAMLSTFKELFAVRRNLAHGKYGTDFKKKKNW